MDRHFQPSLCFWACKDMQGMVDYGRLWRQYHVLGHLYMREFQRMQSSVFQVQILTQDHDTPPSWTCGNHPPLLVAWLPATVPWSHPALQAGDEVWLWHKGLACSQVLRQMQVSVVKGRWDAAIMGETCINQSVKVSLKSGFFMPIDLVMRAFAYVCMFSPFSTFQFSSLKPSCFFGRGPHHRPFWRQCPMILHPEPLFGYLGAMFSCHSCHKSTRFSCPNWRVLWSTWSLKFDLSWSLPYNEVSQIRTLCSKLAPVLLRRCQTTEILREDFHLCNAADIFDFPRHLFELRLECQSLRKPQTDAILCSDQRLWASIGVRDGSSKHCGGWRWECWQIHLVVGHCGASSNPHTQQDRNSVSGPLSSSLWSGRTRSSGEAAGCSPSDELL